MKLRFWRQEHQEEHEIQDGYFKPFHETYRITFFYMACGFLYPNPRTERARLTGMVLSVIISLPMTYMMVFDSWNSWLAKDYVNMIRHSTVAGPFMAGFLKMFLMFYKRDAAKKIIDEISSDYASYNHMPQDYKKVAFSSVQDTLLYREAAWSFCVFTCVMIFPLMSVTLNLYNFIFLEEPQKYMIHDVNLPHREPEARFESPEFEIAFVYTFYCACCYVVNFTGYDGFYGLVMNHACLKLTMFCKALDDAFTVEADDEELRRKVVNVIKEQLRFYRYIDLVQETFEMWLGLIFVATMIQICGCMYQVIEGLGFDLRYAIFVTGSVVHIYLPCLYGAKIKYASVESATEIYLTGWERTNNQSIRKIIIFMIARSQVACEIRAFNMVSFDMELFLSILQTSYSMFTLLRS